MKLELSDDKHKCFKMQKSGEYENGYDEILYEMLESGEIDDD
jgi:hypothetical protein